MERDWGVGSLGWQLLGAPLASQQRYRALYVAQMIIKTMLQLSASSCARKFAVESLPLSCGCSAAPGRNSSCNGKSTIPGLLAHYCMSSYDGRTSRSKLNSHTRSRSLCSTCCSLKTSSERTVDTLLSLLTTATNFSTAQKAIHYAHRAYQLL